MTKDNNMLGTFELTGIPPAPRGVPQIEVAFEIDAIGILVVTASDKSTGKSNKISIRNEKGRLSKEEIDRMVGEAEAFKEQDEKQRENVTARNQLENYAFQVRQAAREYGDKMDQGDKEKVLKAADEALKWVETNTLADKEEYSHKLKEIEQICSTVMAKLHQGSAPSENAQAKGQRNANGPTVEEVD